MKAKRVDLGQLAAELTAGEGGLTEEDQQVGLGLYRALANGHPVDEDALARGLGLDHEMVSAALRRGAQTMRDEPGRIIGFAGLSLTETAHRFEVNGTALYTWCAWDALFLPELIGQTARVSSACPATGEPIALTVDPGRVREIDPPETVVSFLTPRRGFAEDVVSSFCCFVNFFASPAAGETWTVDHEGTFLLSVGEAHALGWTFNRHRFGNLLDA